MTEPQALTVAFSREELIGKAREFFFKEVSSGKESLEEMDMATLGTLVEFAHHLIPDEKVDVSFRGATRKAGLSNDNLVRRARATAFRGDNTDDDWELFNELCNYVVDDKEIEDFRGYYEENGSPRGHILYPVALLLRLDWRVWLEEEDEA